MKTLTSTHISPDNNSFTITSDFIPASHGNGYDEQSLPAEVTIEKVIRDNDGITIQTDEIFDQLGIIFQNRIMLPKKLLLMVLHHLE